VGTAIEYVDFPVRIRELEVVRTAWISATTIRLTLGGPGASGFESAIFDEHVKLIYPDVDSGELRLPTPDGDDLDWPRPFPTSREYTIRSYRPDVGEIDIDFVAHAGGLAADWVRAAQPGEPLHVAGPPGGYRVGDDYTHYLLAGDETALPAIARWLEEMPHDRRGWAYIEVPGAASQIELVHPAGIEIVWLFTGDGGTTALAEAVQSTSIPEGADVFVWLAGEAGAIKPLRRWVRDDLGIGKEHSSITGYWKRGLADTHEHLDDDDDED